MQGVHSDQLSIDDIQKPGLYVFKLKVEDAKGQTDRNGQQKFQKLNLSKIKSKRIKFLTVAVPKLL